MTAHSWSIPDMILRYTDEFGFRPDPMAHPMTPIIQVRRLLLLFPRTINNNNNKILRRRAIQSDSRRLTGIHRRLSPVSVVLHIPHLFIDIKTKNKKSRQNWRSFFGGERNTRKKLCWFGLVKYFMISCLF
jgi:hypothetical protein